MSGLLDLAYRPGTSAGRELGSPSFQSSDLIQSSKWSSLGWPSADKLGARSLRRDPARASVSAGGSFAQFLRAGQWRGNPVRAYLGLGGDERRALTDILIEGSDDEPPKLPLSCSFSASIESRSVCPLLAFAGKGAFGVLGDLRIEVYLDMLVRMNLWDGDHGSIFPSGLRYLSQRPSWSSEDRVRFRPFLRLWISFEMCDADPGWEEPCSFSPAADHSRMGLAAAQVEQLESP